MQTAAMATEGYSQNRSQTKTAKSIEYDAVSKITFLMQSSLTPPGIPFSRLCEVIGKNRKLWRIFSLEALNPQNPLARETKERILSLASFVDSYSSRVLRREADPTALVEINIAIMRGLKGEGDGQ